MYNLAGRPLQAHDLHQPAVCAAGGEQSGRASEEAARASASGRRPPTAAFTLKEGECLGRAAMRPWCCMNNTTMLSWMTPEKIDELIDSQRKPE
jgi:NADH:ubiquinone oxidoreductase subunit E